MNKFYGVIETGEYGDKAIFCNIKNFVLRECKLVYTK